MLTERRIRDAKPGPKPSILWDSHVSGLGCKVFPSGKKAFVLSYRSGGRKRLATIARASEISLKDARERGGRELAAIRAGETDPLERRRQSREAPTVCEGVERFFRQYAPYRVELGLLSERTIREYDRQARFAIIPFLGTLRIADVTRHDIDRMVEAMPNVQRNRVLAFASRMFNLFEAWDLRPQMTNPVRGIERAREQPRDRILSPSELGLFAQALKEAGNVNPAAIAAIRFAALTGLRIGEVREIRWNHVDFEGGRLTMPKTKTGRRTHHLPAPALQVLTTLPPINEWVFTTGRPAPISYKTIRDAFARITRSAGLGNVRLHDLRRTVMTTAAAAGVGTHVLRDLLGHKTTLMADRYIRRLGSPVRDARERVAAQMAAMMEGRKEGEVVPMERGGG